MRQSYNMQYGVTCRTQVPQRSFGIFFEVRHCAPHQAFLCNRAAGSPEVTTGDVLGHKLRQIGFVKKQIGSPSIQIMQSLPIPTMAVARGKSKQRANLPYAKGDTGGDLMARHRGYGDRE